MKLPWRGGLLLFLLVLQDPNSDRIARFTAIMEKGPDSHRDLAARGLLSLGRPGYEALRRVLASKPDLAKSVPAPGDSPPPAALVRIPAFGDEEAKAREAAATLSRNDLATDVIYSLGSVAEPFLWETLASRDILGGMRAFAALRSLYTPPDHASAGWPSDALRSALETRRTFDVTDQSLAAILAAQPISWILMAPRDERITIKLREVTLRDFLRIALPKLAAIPIGDLLILIPPDRIAPVEPPAAVWATADLAPRIEAAIAALAKGDEGPAAGLTGVGAYHALRRAARLGGPAMAARADEIRKPLEQRILFVNPESDPATPVTLAPVGTSARETRAAFEKAAGAPLVILDASRLDAAPPAFRFRGIPAKLAARVLEFRLNRIY